MALHILIDGYNLIKSGALSGIADRGDLQQQREALIEMLAEYKRLRHHPITVVFDGANAPGSLTRKERAGGIEIRFSRPGQSADTLIKNMAARQREKALVVTADREIARFAESKGATVLNSFEFGKKIARARITEGAFMDPEEDMEGGWRPTTRKKGPPRRAPKRVRKALKKMKKL